MNGSSKDTDLSGNRAKFRQRNNTRMLAGPQLGVREATLGAAAAWLLTAILLPKQLQCEMFVFLQLAVQRWKIGSGAILAACLDGHGV